MNLGQFLDPKVQKKIALALVSEQAAEIVDGVPLDEVGEVLQALAGDYPEWESRISEKYWFFGEEDFETAKEAFPVQFETYQKALRSIYGLIKEELGTRAEYFQDRVRHVLEKLVSQEPAVANSKKIDRGLTR